MKVFKNFLTFKRCENVICVVNMCKENKITLDHYENVIKIKVGVVIWKLHKKHAIHQYFYKND